MIAICFDEQACTSIFYTLVSVQGCIPYKSNEHACTYMNMRVCMHILKTFMKIAAHVPVDYYLSPMIPAELSNNLENLLCCICGLTNKTVLCINYVHISMHHKASGGVARTR